MALLQVANLRDNVQALLTGIDLDDVPDLYGAFRRAASTTVQKADIPEASNRQSFMLYDGVFNYPELDGIFGGAIVDLRPQGVVRQPWDDDYKQPINLFDRTKEYNINGYKLAFEYYKGQGIMRIATPNVTPNVVLNPMNDNTQWTAGGTISSIAVDTTVYYQQPAALRFTLTGAGAGTITNNAATQINLSIYQGVGVVFAAIMIPQGTDPTTLTSISLKIGSSATDYNEVSATEGFLGTWVSGQYLLVAFDFAGATTTGTPNWSALDYDQLTFTTSDTIVNMRVGYLFMALPSPVEALYYSSWIFLDSNNDQMAEPTSVDDYIILQDAAYNIYVHEAARAVALQQGGGLSSNLVGGIDLVLEGDAQQKKVGLYQQYRGDNPSEEIREVGSYYDGANY